MGSNGITTGTVPTKPITAEQVVGAFNGLPSGNGLAQLLIENQTDCSLYAYSPLIAAERFITESIASLPVVTYKKDGEGKSRATDHPAYNLLKTKPNNYQIPFYFYKTLLQIAIRRGNAYALIERNGAGQPANLIILNPDYCSVVFEGGVKFYKYKSPQVEGTIADEDMIHLLGFSNDGIIGQPLITYASKAIKLGLAVERYAQKYFENGTATRGVLKAPPNITPEQYSQVVDAWQAAHTGNDNAWTTPVLAYGVEWQDVSVPNNDAQLIELRKYQLLETARLMRVSPYAIQHYEAGGTYQNIEAQGADLVKNCLQHWITPLEQELTAKLCTGDYFVELLVDARLRGDTKSRYEAYQIGRNGGWLSINDIRRFENMPDVDGGDTYLITPMGGSPNPNDASNTSAASQDTTETVAEDKTDTAPETPSEDKTDRSIDKSIDREQLNKAMKEIAADAALEVVRTRKKN